MASVPHFIEVYEVATELMVLPEDLASTTVVPKKSHIAKEDQMVNSCTIAAKASKKAACESMKRQYWKIHDAQACGESC